MVDKRKAGKFFVFLFASFFSFVTAQTSSLDYIRGNFNPATEAGFEAVPSSMALQKNLYLRHEVISALKRMAQAGKKDGVFIYVVSATRTYQHQKNIWQAKYLGKRKSGGVFLNESMSSQEKVNAILNYSSMPGTSRHHWGSDLDLFFKTTGIRLENSEFAQGEGLRLYRWLQKNAKRFGFCQPYKNLPTERRQGYHLGYLEEKWHWSYVPLSLPLTQYAQKNIQKLQPSGIGGEQFAKDVFYQYILNIHPDCL